MIEQSRTLAADAILAYQRGDLREHRRKWRQHEFVDKELREIVDILLNEEQGADGGHLEAQAG